MNKKSVQDNLLPLMDDYVVDDVSESCNNKKKRTKKASAKCAYCGKPLTDPVSVEAGVGPVCLHRHFEHGQRDYKSNLFMQYPYRMMPSYNIEWLDNDIVIIYDKDDCEECPSVTNAIEAICEVEKIDFTEKIVICYGTDGIFARYNGVWSFAGKSIDDVKNKYIKG